MCYKAATYSINLAKAKHYAQDYEAKGNTIPKGLSR